MAILDQSATALSVYITVNVSVTQLDDWLDYLHTVNQDESQMTLIEYLQERRKEFVLVTVLPLYITVDVSVAQLDDWLDYLHTVSQSQMTLIEYLQEKRKTAAESTKCRAIRH